MDQTLKTIKTVVTGSRAVRRMENSVTLLRILKMMRGTQTRTMMRMKRTRPLRLEDVLARP